MVVPGWQLGLPVQQVRAYQQLNENGSYIWIPVGPRQQLTNFLIDTGAQISIFTQQDADELGIQPGQQKVKITGVTGTCAVRQTTKVYLWLPGEKHMTSFHFAIKDHDENILGFDALNSRNLASARW